MPVACARAAAGGTTPARTATSTTTSRRMLVSLLRFGSASDRYPAGRPSFPARKATRPAHQVDGPRERSLDQKRTPPVRMNVLPPPISPRASANGVIVPFTLNVVPPSRFSPALVSETLAPPDGPADACAMFRPPPAYGRRALLVGTRNR